MECFVKTFDLLLFISLFEQNFVSFLFMIETMKVSKFQKKLVIISNNIQL